jgi:hypothetical protein
MTAVINSNDARNAPDEKDFCAWSYQLLQIKDRASASIGGTFRGGNVESVTSSLGMKPDPCTSMS